MRRDFFEIVERARQLLFNVKVKTNGVMIHEKEAARLRQLGVEQVQISVYSHRPEVHDAITKLPGSLKRTIRAIRFLKSQGLKVTIANVLMAGNFSDQPGVIALANELGVAYTLDPTITPKMDGDRSILALRIPGSDLKQIFHNGNWWAMWKNSALLRLHLAKTSWKAFRVAPVTPPATFLLTAMSFPACNSLFPAAMCAGKSSSTSGAILRS